ncbi:helix-turn-helix domain-containing protein [Umezawaea sp. Da 62-37]|uniref:MarR family transcriptional regulator n=1 Tax=Umezawaea sp. Da 62-37 TaxID=3075927 RepID=UPI0028F71F32|nr:helix-turn-helix domain-containing protein [Umezawaea sp. Da 62-37]WNV89475.1 helix-turn-helix domain-containing protein [Umezawaea sp. Da 62-37]
MNGVELFLLGRTLMKIGENAMPSPPDGTRGSTRVVLIVLSDVLDHPDTSVGAIAERTRLPQSQVSTAVARLTEAGSVETASDPTDRRRRLIRRADTTSDRVAEVRGTTIDAALAGELGTDDPRRVAEVAEALRALAQLLAP